MNNKQAEIANSIMTNVCIHLERFIKGKMTVDVFEDLLLEEKGFACRFLDEKYKKEVMDFIKKEIEPALQN